MKPWVSIWSLLLFFSTGTFSCGKEQALRPYAFLQLRVLGSEEDVAWDGVSAPWNANTGAFELDAVGVKHDHCRIHLQDPHTTGPVSSITVENFSYSDGLTINPTRIVDGVLKISELSEHTLKAKFSFYLTDDAPQAGSVVATGVFGIEGGNNAV